LDEDDLSVRVLAKTPVDLGFERVVWVTISVMIATSDRTLMP
jgi:hypothetical protein